MNKIRTKGMLFTLGLIFVAVFISGISSYNRFKKILVNEVDEAVVRVAKESADHLDNYISQFIAPLVALSENPISFKFYCSPRLWQKRKSLYYQPGWLFYIKTRKRNNGGYLLSVGARQKRQPLYRF